MRSYPLVPAYLKCFSGSLQRLRLPSVLSGPEPHVKNPSVPLGFLITVINRSTSANGVGEPYYKHFIFIHLFILPPTAGRPE